MKKIISIFAIIAICIMLCSCVGGRRLERRDNTDFRILVNSGSVFVYEIKDVDTGVWYMCAGGGITPKLNADGSLYTGCTTEKGSEE